MLRTLKTSLSAWLTLCLALVGSELSTVASLSAQEVTPAVVVSIAPVQEQLDDFLYAAGALGMKDQAGPLTGLVPVLLNGVELKKPIGLYVVAAAGEPTVVGFVPVSDIKKVFATHEDRIGKPEEVSAGIYKFETPGQSVFVKDANGWAYLADSQEKLAQVPGDPLKMLGDLPAKYNIAVQLNVREIPQELRDMAISQLEMGFQQGLENAPDNADKEFATQMSGMSLKQIKRLIEEIKSVAFGINIDAQEKIIHIDTTLIPVEGTGMARQVAQVGEKTKSNFAGFLMPGSSVVALSSTPIAGEDIEETVQMLELFRGRADKEIDNDAGLDSASRTTAKQLIAQVFEVLTDTVKAGKIDYGASLMLKDKTISFAGGILVADGKKLEAAFAKLVELAKNEPDFPEVKLNAGTRAGVTMHTILAKVDDAEAQQIFGEKLEITLGTGAKNVFVAFGKEGQTLLKKAIDDSATRCEEPVKPAMVNVYLKPIMQFAASMDPSGNPVLRNLAESTAKAPEGSDEITIYSVGIPGGIRSRLQVKEGVLNLIGDAIKSAR